MPSFELKIIRIDVKEIIIFKFSITDNNDDTIYERKRSRKVELLTKVYDHAKDTHTYDFRLLTLGWSDENTFLPVNRSLYCSKNQQPAVVWWY